MALIEKLFFFGQFLIIFCV